MPVLFKAGVTHYILLFKSQLTFKTNELGRARHESMIKLTYHEFLIDYHFADCGVDDGFLKFKHVS